MVDYVWVGEGMGCVIRRVILADTEGHLVSEGYI